MDAPLQQAFKCSLATELLQTAGRLQFRATGLSMVPTLWPGDCLTIQSYNFEDAQAGDVVLYARGGRLFVHRIIRKCRLAGTKSLITRGDCMTEEDPPVQEKDLLGRVIAIDRRGSRIVPNRRLSTAQSVIAWLLCHSSFFLRATLRLYKDGVCEWSLDRSTA
jgi:signal peptidase I